MSTEVVMPQMGESIAEGTVVRWIKKVGDKVDRDEPLFEISTDKVDAEVPSPAAGVVSEIRVKEGETVPVNSVVAVIGAAGETVAAPQARNAPPAASSRPAAPEPPKSSPQGDGNSTAAAAPATKGATATVRPASAAEAAPARPASVVTSGSTEEAIRQRSSPRVRKIAKGNNGDRSQLQGS